jgi:tetratricopeptide (TPR) repeat protein
MEQVINNFENFQEQIAQMNNHDEIVSYYIEYRNYLVFTSPERALIIIKEGYEKYENHENEDYKFKLLSIWGNTLIILEQYKEALEKNLICLKYFLSKNDSDSITILIGNTAGIFFRLEMQSYAMYLWELILKKYVNPNNKYFIDLILCNITMVKLNFLHHIDFNIEVIEDLIAHYKSQDKNRKNLQILFFSLHNKARYYSLKNNYLNSIQILEDLILDYDQNDFVSQKIDVYFDLGNLYRKIDNEEKMIFCFKNVIKIGEDLNLKLLFSNVYNELYEYYKSKSNYKKALECLEKYNKYKEIEIDLKKKVNASIKEIGIDRHLFSNSKISNIFNNDRIEINNFIFCENHQGIIVKIDSMNIIYSQLDEKGITVFLANNEIICIKGLFKNFTNQLYSLYSENQIFFETNARDTIINLFWISKISINQKIVYLRPYQNEIPILLSKRKWVEFKKLLNF